MFLVYFTQAHPPLTSYSSIFSGLQPKSRSIRQQRSLLCSTASETQNGKFVFGHSPSSYLSRKLNLLVTWLEFLFPRNHLCRLLLRKGTTWHHYRTLLLPSPNMRHFKGRVVKVKYGSKDSRKSSQNSFMKL